MGDEAVTRNEAKDRVVEAARQLLDDLDRGDGPLKTRKLEVALAMLDATPDSEGWRPIKTLPNDMKECWIGNAEIGAWMLARPSRGIPGTWRTPHGYGDRLVGWLPTHWQPSVPAPPSQEQK